MLSLIIWSLFIAIDCAFAASSSAAALLGPDKVSAAWYAGWHAQDFPLEQVSWGKYTHLIYSFAVPTPDPATISVADSDAQLLTQFVSLAHQNGVQAMLSIGGWGGSRYFSSNVGSAENRTAFVKSVTDLVSKYGLDGIDFDWEYPAKQGTGCNTISTNDTPNFLSFLQELRSSPAGASLTLSAATSLTPWNDTSSNPSTDVSAFGQLLDWIAIMNYDLWTYQASPEAVKAGVGSVVGPNSPLDDSCVEQERKGVGSASFAVKAWTGAGFPAEKIVLGVPSYGHSFIVPKSAAFVNGSTSSSSSSSSSFGSSPTATTFTASLTTTNSPSSPSSSPSSNNSVSLASYPPFTPQSPSQHRGDKWSDTSTPGPDICGVQQPLTPAGTYNLWGLVKAGFLKEDGSVNEEKGVVYRWDGCSQTPYAYHPTLETMVSYDDAKSFSAKGSFISANFLKGFAMWEAGGDYKDILLDSILSATVASSNSNETQGKKTGAQDGGDALRLRLPQNTIGWIVGAVLAGLTWTCL